MSHSTQPRGLDEPRVPVDFVDVLARLLHQCGEVRLVRENREVGIVTRVDAGQKPNLRRIERVIDPELMSVARIDPIPEQIVDMVRALAKEILE